MAFLRRYYYKKKLFLILAVVVDFLLLPVKLFVKPLVFSQINIPAGKKILIFSLGGIGDAVLLEPTVRFLKKIYPAVAIDLVTNQLSANIFNLIPGLNDIFIFPNFKKGFHPIAWYKFYYQFRGRFLNNYAVSIDTKGDPLVIIFMLAINSSVRVGFINGGLQTLLQVAQDNTISVARSVQLLSLCGGSKEDFAPHLNVSLSLLKTGQDLLDQLVVDKSKNILGVHLGAGDSSKLLPLKFWEEILNNLIQKYNVIFFGSLADKNIFLSLPDDLRKNIIDLSGLPVIDAVGAMTKTVLFIGHDSGLSHVASALGIKTLCLFSLINDPKIWAPNPAHVITFDPLSPSVLLPDEVIDYVNSL